MLKFTKAEKNAKTLLKRATKSLESNDLSSYYNNISQALFGYLGDKLKIQTADFTLDKAILKMSENNVDPVLVNKVKSIAEKCEFARFAPNAVGNDNGGEIYRSVEAIIKEMESSVKFN